MNQWHLMRVSYQTDIIEDEPEYQGSVSGTIPNTAFTSGQKIVGVDWSQRGWVEVTYLLPGPGVTECGSDRP